MQEVNLIGRLSTGGSYVPVIESKTITENGIYSAPEGVDGYNPINVSVSGGGAVIEPKTITENGTYTASDGVDGYSPIDVLVTPLLEDKYINENGLYGPSDGYDGIRSVNVDVPIPSIVPLSITENGTYESSGGSGFNPITVNVPSDPKILTNTFSSSNAASMYINYGIDKIYITWDGGNYIECFLSGNQNLKEYNTLTFNIRTGTSYYNTIGEHSIRELYFGVSRTKESVRTDPTTVNWLDYQHVHEDNTTYSYTIDLTRLESEGAYIYISANGWNITNLQVSLS
jgi:hypothetical protein